MTNDWKARHDRAMVAPNADEMPMVELVNAIDVLVMRHGDDYVLREGIAQLIKGTEVLLNAEFGRLDRGTISSFLDSAAEAIGFNIEIGEFN